MRIKLDRPFLTLAVIAALATFASAQGKPNQTQGYGDGKLLTFTYTQIRLRRPAHDRSEFQRRRRSEGSRRNADSDLPGWNSADDQPSGKVGNPAVTTEPVYVLVPMSRVTTTRIRTTRISCNGVVSGTTAVPRSAAL